MPFHDQAVGIIEIDAEPNGASLSDSTLGGALLLLQATPDSSSSPQEAMQFQRWHDVNPADRQAMRADLAQLANELVAEYRRLLTLVSTAAAQ